MRSTPSSTARRRTLRALLRSGGQPQMPSPVIRIAPKPSRLTLRSPPNCQVGFAAVFIVVEEVAPNIASDPPAKSAAPPATVAPRNVRRVTAGFCFGSTDSSAMTRRNYVYGNRYQRQRNSSIEKRCSAGRLDWRSRNIKCLDAPRFSYLKINSHRDGAGDLFPSAALPKFPAARIIVGHHDNNALYLSPA